MSDPPGLARVLDGGKMLKQRLQARLLETFKDGNSRGGRSESNGSPWNQSNRNR
jgi:hypothetical protein